MRKSIDHLVIYHSFATPWAVAFRLLCLKFSEARTLEWAIIHQGIFNQGSNPQVSTSWGWSSSSVSGRLGGHSVKTPNLKFKTYNLTYMPCETWISKRVKLSGLIKGAKFFTIMWNLRFNSSKEAIYNWNKVSVENFFHSYL